VLAAFDIHKAVFQAAVLNPDDGQITEERFEASRTALIVWLAKWHGQITVVALEATTGWRWVARELQARSIEVRLCDPGQASALQGKRKRPKTDRLDARWLVLLLAREMLPDAWLAPEDIQRLRDQTRLRKALSDDHTRWAQRLHSLLVELTRFRGHLSAWPAWAGREGCVHAIESSPVFAGVPAAGRGAGALQRRFDPPDRRRAGRLAAVAAQLG